MKKSLFNLLIVFSFVLLLGCCMMACARQEESVDNAVKIKYVRDFETDVVISSVYSVQSGSVILEKESGMRFAINYDDQRLSYSQIDTSSLGPKTLTISYTEDGTTLTYDLIVHVYLDSVTSIKDVVGMKKFFKQNEAFDTNDIKVQLNMRSGIVRELDVGTIGLDVGQVDTTTVGLHHLYVGYGDLTPTMYEYVVYDKSYINVASAQIVGTFSKKVSLGSVYDISGIILELKLQIAGLDELQIQQYAIDDLVVALPDTSTSGTKILKVSLYDGDLDATYSAQTSIVVK